MCLASFLLTMVDPGGRHRGTGYACDAFRTRGMWMGCQVRTQRV